LTPSDSDRWLAAYAFRPQLVAMLRGQGLTRCDAEHIASETVLKAGRQTDLEPHGLPAWCRVVARHASIELHRKAPRADLLSRVAHSEPPVAEPQAAVDDRLEAEWVAGLVATLPEQQRRVLQLRANGWSTSQIAAEMSLSYKAVESLTSRARHSVRAMIAAGGCVVAAATAVWRRAWLPVTPVVVAAAATTLIVATPWSPSAPPAARGGAPRVTEFTATTGATAAGGSRDRVTTTPLARPPRLAPPGSVAAAVATDRRPTTVLKGRRVADTGHSDVEITRDDEDRTFVESVQDCLAGGLEVTPQNVGCRQDAGASPSYDAAGRPPD
jgi:RNA polymerase sigma factor (sigma-70 family)